MSDSPYTLLIIDMQREFTSANCDVTTREIIKAINRAKQDDATILIVDFWDYGPTRPEILHAALSYHRTHQIYKQDQDGHLIVGHFINHWLLPQSIKACGVNLGQCVRDTIEGLAVNFAFDVELLLAACNQPSSLETGNRRAIWGYRQQVRHMKAQGIVPRGRYKVPKKKNYSGNPRYDNQVSFG